MQNMLEDEAEGKKVTLIYNKMVKDINVDIDYNADVCVPDLQINIGNVCNLKCRTCSPMLI